MAARSAAEAWPERVARLEAEVAGLRQAMRTRGLIEQAKGRLTERLGIDPEQAFQHLVGRSQATNRKVVEVAAEVMGTAAPSGAGVEKSTQDGGVEPAGNGLESVVDAVAAPTVLLTPVRDGEESIADFRIDHANTGALAEWTNGAGTPIGRRLLDTEPTLIGSGGFDACVRAYEGEDQPVVGTSRAARIGDQVILSWATDPETAGRISAMERLGGFGWGEWGPTLEPIVWSDGLYDVLGRDRADGPVRLDRLLIEDRDRVVHQVREVLDDGREVSFEVRLKVGGSARPMRLVVAPRTNRRAILALFQDLTGVRNREADLARTSERLATQQMRSASQQSRVAELRTALFPAAETRLRHHGFTVVARHATSTIPRFRGDFYEANTVGDELFLVIGDVFGSGVAAADAMVRLRHSARALTLAGLGPAPVVQLLNQELCGDAEPPMASLLVLRLGADPRQLTWAQAGHYSPLLLRGDRGRALRRPRGDILGLDPEARYAEATVALQPDDRLICYTDGVLNRHRTAGNPIARFAAEIAAHRGDDLATLAEQFTRPTEDEACLIAIGRSA